MGSTPHNTSGETHSMSSGDNLGLEEALFEVFSRFAEFGTGNCNALDNARFAKLCTDCDLDLDPAAVDIVFTKAKEKGQRKLSYKQFCRRALPELAVEANVPIDALIEQIVDSQGPRVGFATMTNTNGVFGKLTDVDQYTGMYGSRFDKSPSIKTSGPMMRRDSLQKLPQVPRELWDDLRLAFEEFAAYGSGFAAESNMSNANFAKLCRDSGLIDDRRMPPREVDIIFQKVKQHGKRLISFQQFLHHALPLLAAGKRMEVEDLGATVIRSRPVTMATQAHTDSGIFRRLTDEDLYTGTHADKFGRPLSSRHGSSSASSPAPKKPLPVVPAGSTSAVAATFKEFCWFGASAPQQHSMSEITMDNSRFAKLVRDSMLLRRTKLTAADVDLAFTKSLARGKRRISQREFVETALPNLAVSSGERIEDIANAIGRARPLTSATVTRTSSGIYQRLTDANQYTGMYAERFGRSLSKEYKDGGFELQDTLHKRNLPDVPQIFHGELKQAVGRFGGVSGDIGEDNFFRMARDANLRNNLLTDSQIVAIFGLCKEKHLDTMEFEAFLTKAVPLLSLTAEIDIQRVCKRLVDAEPEAVHNKFARAVRNASVFDKLTDVNSYTGMYKERFRPPSAAMAMASPTSSSKTHSPYSRIFGAAEA